MKAIMLGALVSALAAVDIGAPLPPKIDAIYRNYLVALAKAYQAETAKLDVQLKREAAMAKREPDLLAAITKLQERIRVGDQMTDFAGLVSRDLLGADQIMGGEAALIGSWTITGQMTLLGQTGWELKVKPDHTAAQTIITAMSRQDFPMPWAVKGSQVIFTMADDRFALRQWIITLPLPTTGPVTITDRYTGRGANLGSNQELLYTATRKP